MPILALLKANHNLVQLFFNLNINLSKMRTPMQYMSQLHILHQLLDKLLFNISKWIMRDQYAMSFIHIPKYNNI